MTTFLDPNDARLTAYALGELDEHGRTELEQLLEASPELQAELAEITNLVGMLRTDLASEPVPAFTAAQRQELADPAIVSGRVPPVVPVASTHARRRIRRWAIFGTGAAVVTAELGFAIHLLTTSTHSVPRSDPSSLVENSRLSKASPTDVRLAESARTAATFDGDQFGVGQGGFAGGQGGGQGGFGGGQGGFGGSQFGDGRMFSGGVQSSGSVTTGPTGISPETRSTRTERIGVPFAPVSRKSGDLLSDGESDSTILAPLNVTAESKPSGQSKPNESKGDGITSYPLDGIAARGSFDPDNEGFDLAKRGLAEESRKPNAAPAAKFVKEQVPTVRYNMPTPTLSLSAAAIAKSLSTAAVAKADPAVPHDLNVRHGFYDAQGNERYEAPAENSFLTPGQQPLSTFSIDVDSASYSNIRRILTQGQLPPLDAVRIEEMVNYFNYSYPQPKDGEPFSVIADAAPCPWQREHYLARIALQARTIDKAKRPPTNLVFLLDVSGSMQAANKLPLVKQAMTMLTEELNERDRIAIVTYAGDAGIRLTSTPGSDQVRIMQSIESLQAGGSTNGAAGINVAYELALQNFNGEGENRVILCTDGDFNVGVSDDEQLVQLIQQQAKSKVFLSIFGFGMGNLKDAKLEKLADKGNGHYDYIDDLKEARRVFNEELVGTLYTVAKDVKIQVEFNPLTVGAYRLIGYENRALAAKDFNDDTKDAGEIGAGHTVTALYEIVPRGQWPKTQAVDPLKYASVAKDPAPAAEPPHANIPADAADDLFTVKLRYKQPTSDTSVKTIDYVVDDIAGKKIAPSADFLWAASVASFGMHLRQSQFKGQWTLSDVYETAQGAKGADTNGRRREFLDLVQTAKRLSPQSVRSP